MHNGKLYSEGSYIELTEEQAKRLEDFVTLVPEKKTTQNGNKNQNTNKNTANKNAGEKKDGENNDNN